MTPGGDDGLAWVARVVAGDPVARRILNLSRRLSPEQFEAFVTTGERLRDGMPMRTAAVQFYLDVGMTSEEAEATAKQVLGQ